MAGLRFRTIARVRQLLAATVRPCRRTSLGHFLPPSSSSGDDRWDGDHWTAWRRGHTGHSHHRDGREAEKVFRLSLAADVGLAAGKAVAGYLSGSTAIIADAAHSVSDVVSRRCLLLDCNRFICHGICVCDTIFTEFEMISANYVTDLFHFNLN